MKFASNKIMRKLAFSWFSNYLYNWTKKNKAISIYFSIRYLRIGRLLGFKAGIAQLVEQATENRRVPSSNLGPGTIIKHLIGAFLIPKTKYSCVFRVLSSLRHKLSIYKNGMEVVWKLPYQINKLLLPRCFLNLQVFILETQNWYIHAKVLRCWSSNFS